MAVAVMVPLGAVRSDVATLTTIASRVDGRTGVVSIESSDPVAYVASQPDPRVFVVELREVQAAGFADKFIADPRNPIASVQVESGRATVGVDVARVRMTLRQAVRPRVRSSRNVIFVEAGDERLVNESAESAAVSLATPAAVIRDVRVQRRGAATIVNLLGTGRLVAATVEESADGPRRLTLNLPNATSAVPNTTVVKQGPVENVRLGINPREPQVMQVVLELSRPAAYRLESSANGQDLAVVFDEPAADPITALQTTAAVPTTAAAPIAQAPVPPVTAPAPVAPPARSLAQAVTAGAQTPAAQGQRYTGNPVSLDFQGADLRAVLRTFSEISGLNVVLDPTIQGTVDVALRDVPWDQALDIILRANKLGYVVDGTIVRVAPLTVLADEEMQRRKLAEEQALSGELHVLTRALSYARAEDLRALLTATVLSPRGTIQQDTRTNTIIINDLQDRLDRATALLTTLDVPQPQVEIEARIVQTSRTFARQLGVQWGASGQASAALGNTLPLSFPNQASIGGRTGGATDTQADAGSNVVNLGVQAATSAIGVALGSVNGAVNLDVALSALESTGQGRILSTPRVSTQNNVEAEITQGVQIPIQTVANNTVTVTFRDAALTLKVTPQITAANTVIMRISVENAAPDFSRQVNNIPPIDTQRAITQVLVSDGDTTVIGGIYVSREQTTQDRTPGLNRLPLLGWLFKRDTLADENRELLIFITPRIQRL
jgi:type IV pilus assembly protein PilQ